MSVVDVVDVVEVEYILEASRKCEKISFKTGIAQSATFSSAMVGSDPVAIDPQDPLRIFYFNMLVQK